MSLEIEKGKVYEGEVIDFSHDGGGVVKIEDYIVFLDKGVIGDVVKFKVDKVKKNYCNGSVSEIVKRSEDRVEVENISESLGGIPLVEYNYEKQLDWKKDKIRKDLEKISNLTDVNMKEIVKMDNPFNYRNHVQIPVTSFNNNTYVGFYEKNSQRVVDMDSSILMSENSNKVFKIVKSWIKENRILGYNNRENKGSIRHIGLRSNDKDEVMVIIVTNGNRLPKKDDLLERLKDEDVVSVYHNIKKSKSSVVYGREYHKLAGEDYLVDRIGDLEFLISPNSFFQVNRIQANNMYAKVIDYLNLKKTDVVYDLFSGIGSISLEIAKKAKFVYGIEMVEEAVLDAEENARLNKIDNIEFINAPVESIFKKLIKKGKTANKLVLDPPRTGCEKEVIDSIIELNPEVIVYVSCNPSTMARDITPLLAKGYKLEELTPVDMFPMTAHVECIALLQREIM